MMNASVSVLFLLNFIFIGALPIFFFRRDGRFNGMWCLTAAPFFLCALILIASLGGWISPLIGYGTPPGRLLEILSVPFSVASIALIFVTVGIHRIPISLWHQENDAPRQIVTYGPYRWVRHPFYVSFLLSLLGVLLFFPHPATVFTLVYGYLVLNYTAAREERRLQASQFGAEYEAYMRQTGRFLPRGGGKTI
ncbi:MAG: isoprenylcysteine carboxylmethyltransferase family protein [Candidatus Manganitrophaceae bacterium]